MLRSLRAVRVLTAPSVLLACAAGGCASVSGESTEEAPSEALAIAPDVAVSQLARELGLRNSQDVSGRVVLESADGARILLFPGTRIASIVGRTLDLSQAPSAAGNETWLCASDAAAIRATWGVQSVLGTTLPGRSAGSGYRVPIPAAPRTHATGPSDRQTGPTAPASFGDNRPTTVETASWSVPIRRRWQYIVVHHSASAIGSAAMIDRWHKDQGWDGLGYDFVIGNGTASPDGAVETGYRWKQQRVGAHAKTADNFMNEHGIGICLVGDFSRTRPTRAQLRSLDRLCTFLAQYCGIPAANLRMHGDVKSTECPGRHFPHDFAIRVPSSAARTAAAAPVPARGTR